MIVLLAVPIPGKNEQLLSYMLGQLSGFTSAIVAAHYVRRSDQNEVDQRRSQRESSLINVIQTRTLSDAEEQKSP